MSTSDPSLTVKFFWDNSAGVYWGELPSGVRFAVARHDVGGKLERNLDLFRQAVTPQSDSRRVSASKAEIRKEIKDLDLSKVQKFKGGKLVVDFDDLDFGD